MENRYELVIKSAIKILNVFVLVFALCLAIIIYINRSIELPKIWNLCFLIPMMIVAFSCIIELVICFWKVVKIGSCQDKIANRKSGLIFSSCITFLVFISNFIAYIIFSLIFFSC